MAFIRLSEGIWSFFRYERAVALVCEDREIEVLASPAVLHAANIRHRGCSYCFVVCSSLFVCVCRIPVVGPQRHKETLLPVILADETAL